MNLKKISAIELKAMAYDCLAVIEQQQYNLRLINGELQSRNQPLLEKGKDEKTNTDSTNS